MELIDMFVIFYGVLVLLFIFAVIIGLSVLVFVLVAQRKNGGYYCGVCGTKLDTLWEVASYETDNGKPLYRTISICKKHPDKKIVHEQWRGMYGGLYWDKVA